MSALPQPDADGSERRVAPRMRTLKRAKVLFNDHFSTFDCIVRNISSTGALLTIDEAAHLPKTFDVRMGEEKTIRPARLVYRRGMLAGIRFLDCESEEIEAINFPAAPNMPASDPFPAERDGRPMFGHVQRIIPDRLPTAITSNFGWIIDAR